MAAPRFKAEARATVCAAMYGPMHEVATPLKRGIAITEEYTVSYREKANQLRAFYYHCHNMPDSM